MKRLTAPQMSIILASQNAHRKKTFVEIIQIQTLSKRKYFALCIQIFIKFPLTWNQITNLESGVFRKKIYMIHQNCDVQREWIARTPITYRWKMYVIFMFLSVLRHEHFATLWLHLCVAVGTSSICYIKHGFVSHIYLCWKSIAVLGIFFCSFNQCYFFMYLLQICRAHIVLIVADLYELLCIWFCCFSLISCL